MIELCHMCKEPIPLDSKWPCLIGKEKDNNWKKVYVCSEDCLDECVDYYKE